MALPDELLVKLKYDYQSEADMQSARGAAEHIGDLGRFDSMIEHWSDPWALVRHLISTRNDQAELK